MEPSQLADLTRTGLAGTRWDLQWVAQTGSTNADLMAEAQAGAQAGRVLVAEFQDAGRGRLDRRWVAPPGSSLLVSVLLRPMSPPSDAYLGAVAVAVAAAEAIDEVAGVTVGLKWPNDLVMTSEPGAGPGPGGSTVRKLGGILSESLVGSGGLDAVVVGVGMNIHVPDAVPDELALIATWLDEHTAAGVVVERPGLLAAFLRRLDLLVDAVDTPGGRTSLLATYRQRCVTLGVRVRVQLSAGVPGAPGGGDDTEFTGMAAAIDDHGRLVVVDDAGDHHTVAAGDVVHVRGAD